MIAQTSLEGLKARIVQQLEEQSCLRTTSTDLAIQARQHTQAVELPPQYKKFTKVFSKKESFCFPPLRPWDHMVEFKKGTPNAIDCKVYLMSQKEDKALRDFLTEQLEKGYICPSKSQYAFSFFFISKKDRKLRPVQDYRCINDCTIQNQYPLPLIMDLITDLRGTHIYTKLDIRWGYNNVRIKEGDEHKAAFKTCHGLYEPTVMFFGLTNSPATFQTMINHLFCPVIAKHELLGFIHVYMEKCLFHVPSIEYLGVILEKGVTCMDPVKIAGIKNWPMPTKVKDIRSFLGFCNFYRAFIKGFSSIA